MNKGMERSTREDFINKSIVVHGDKYDYSKVCYKNNNTKVIIICPIHGEFEQIPRSHLTRGCSKCGRDKTAEKLKNTKENFIERVEKIYPEYDYSEVEYKNMATKVKVLCKQHGAFYSTPNSLLRGNGCYFCGINRRSNFLRKTNNQFIQDSIKVHGLRYDYSKINYKNAETKVTITCKKHGDFEQSPLCHLSGKGCPHCSNSKGEDLIRAYLDEKQIQYECQKVFPDCKDKGYLRYDYYIPSKNLLIEYNGKQHYEPVEYWGGIEKLRDVQYRDRIKSDYAKRNGYNFLIIKFDEDVKEKLENAISR